MSELESLYNDVVEAERQGKFTHEALNWLHSFKNRIKVLAVEADGLQQEVCICKDGDFDLSPYCRNCGGDPPAA